MKILQKIFWTGYFKIKIMIGLSVYPKKIIK